MLFRSLSAGIEEKNIVLDPGIGFAKDAEHNWELLRHIDDIKAIGYPILIGHSRKRFLGGDHPDQREAATIEVTKKLATQGIWGVRVHGVRANVEALHS